MSDTITAIATPPGIGGVGIIRVSGPLAKDIGERLTHKQPRHQHALFAQFFDQEQHIIDFGYLLYFKAPHSFTGEEVIELHGHGGPVVMDMLLQRVLQLGARLAEPGEFSKQAFLNDKIDLIQAEAIADLIESTSTASVKLAQRSLKGDFSNEISQLSDNIIHLRMYVEAALDFPDEEIDFISDAHVSGQLEKLITKTQSILAKARQGALVREGLQLVIVGKPNAGKSTLINQLSGQETAIVTAIAGTTRDIIRETILINGIPFRVVDTAGIRESADEVEMEGIRRAKLALAEADMVLLMVDIDQDIEADVNEFVKMHNINAPVVVVVNKIDKQRLEPVKVSENTIYLSAKLGQGIDLLKQTILSLVGFSKETTEGAYTARRRHLDALRRVEQLLITGQQNLDHHLAGELLAEDLKAAHQALCEITGQFTADDLLGTIFSSFCIGK